MGGVIIGRDNTLRGRILREIDVSGYGRIHRNQLTIMQTQAPGTLPDDEEGLEADYGIPGFICHCENPSEILIRGGRLSDNATIANFIPGLVDNCFSANNPLDFLQFRGLKKLNYEEGRLDFWFNPLYWPGPPPYFLPATLIDCDSGIRVVYDPGTFTLRFYPTWTKQPGVYAWYDVSTWDFTSGWHHITCMWDYDDLIFSMYVDNLKGTNVGAIAYADRPALDWEGWLLVGTDATLAQSMAGCIDEINTRTNRFDIPGAEQIFIDGPSTYLDAGSVQNYSIACYGAGFEYVKPVQIIQSYRPITAHNQNVRIMEGGIEAGRCGYVMFSPDKYSKAIRVHNQDKIRVYFDIMAINLGAF